MVSHRLVTLALVATGLTVSLEAAGGPLVEAAELAIAFETESACRGRLDFTLAGVEGRADVEHRLMLYEGSEVEDVAVSGLGVAGAPRIVGRSLALGVRVAEGRGAYRIDYRVAQPRAWRFRCPVWVPVVPAAAGPGNVRLRIELPPGATPVGGQFPLLHWSSRTGEVRLGNIPALVRAPFAAAGRRVGLLERVGTARLVDLVTVALLAGGTAVWVLVRRRG